MDYIQDSLFGKTSLEHSAATEAKTSERSSKNLSKSSSRQPLCLRFRKTDGHTQTVTWVTDGVLRTEFSMLNTSEKPSEMEMADLYSCEGHHNVEEESTLSQILEANVPEKYYLSIKAAEGILRRAERRGKQLPEMLKTALEQMIWRVGEIFGLASERKIGGIAIAQPVIAVDQGGGKSGANFYNNIGPTLTCTHGGEPAVVYGIENHPAERTPGNAQDCPGADDRVPVVIVPNAVKAETFDVVAVDQQGGKGGANYAINVMPTLCSDSHGTPHAVCFLKGNPTKENESATLSTDNDQHLFQPVAPVLLDDQGGSQMSVRTDGKAPTLRAETHGNVPCVVEERNCIPINDKATRYKGGGADRKNDGAGNGLGVGRDGDPSPTLTSCDRHAVAYCIGNSQTNQSVMSEKVGTLNCMHDQQGTVEVSGMDCRNGRLNGDLSGTLQAKPNGGFSYNCIHPAIVKTPVRYIVRRITPTECARLQGFPDYWGHPERKNELTDAELQFWTDVRNTHAAINGKPVKEYTEKQMLIWYNKLHTDSAEYKMWGNGIALPTALYVMQGIADALKEEE